MRPSYILCALAFAVVSENTTNAQLQNFSAVTDHTPIIETQKTEKRHLNFFIIAKRKKGKLDMPTRFNVLRTKLISFFRSKNFVSIVARDAKEMGDRVEYRLKKKNAKIGTIWFDSHGKYEKGYSLFYVGHDEINYKNLEHSDSARQMYRLAAYADNNSNVVVGSCYGGATYYRSSVDYKDTSRMNGDSLMMALGSIFNTSKIYGCESWVMTMPGLFHKRACVAGHPKRKLFRDVCYRPAWETVGKWNEYNPVTREFSRVNPVSLDRKGNLLITNVAYSEKPRVKENISWHLKKLEPWLYR